MCDTSEYEYVPSKANLLSYDLSVESATIATSSSSSSSETTTNSIRSSNNSSETTSETSSIKFDIKNDEELERGDDEEEEAMIKRNTIIDKAIRLTKTPTLSIKNSLRIINKKILSLNLSGANHQQEKDDEANNNEDEDDLKMNVIIPLMHENSESSLDIKNNENIINSENLNIDSGVVVNKMTRKNKKLKNILKYKSDIYKIKQHDGDLQIESSSLSFRKTNDEPSSSVQNRKKTIIIILLLFVNLLNYIDRFSIAGNSLFFFLLLSICTFLLKQFSFKAYFFFLLN